MFPSRESSLPSLDAMPACDAGFSHVDGAGTQDLTLPQTGLPAKLVWFTGWGGGGRSIARQPVTAVHCSIPEVVGRVGAFAVAATTSDGHTHVISDPHAPRDFPLVRAILDQGFRDLLLSPPFGDRLAHVEDIARDAYMCVAYARGVMIARVFGDERERPAVEQLTALVDEAILRLAKLLPRREELGDYLVEEPRLPVAPGATSIDRVRAMMSGAGRFERIPDEVLASAFAQSYADVRGWRAEEIAHASVELPRFGIAGDPVVSLVGTLTDGRPLRVAHVEDWPSFGPPSASAVPVVRQSYDVAAVRVSDAEREMLLGRVRTPGAGDAGVWLAGEILLARRPAAPGDASAAGLDAVSAEIARALGVGVARV